MATNEHIPGEVRRALGSQEHVQWIGHPDPKELVTKEGAWWMSGLGVYFTALFGFSLVLVIGMLVADPPTGIYRQALLVSIVIALIASIGFGLLMVMAPMWMYWEARTTIYVVTDMRLLVLKKLHFLSSPECYFPSDIKFVEGSTRDDGSGDIFFSEEPWEDSEGNQSFKKIGFRAIPNVREAEEYIVALRNQK